MKNVGHVILAFSFGILAGTGASIGALFLILAPAEELFHWNRRCYADPIMLAFLAIAGGAAAGGLCTFLRRPWWSALSGASGLALLPFMRLLNSDATERVTWCLLTVAYVIAGALAGAEGGLIGQVWHTVSGAPPNRSHVAASRIVQSPAKRVRDAILAFLVGTSAGAGLALLCLPCVSNVGSTVREQMARHGFPKEEGRVFHEDAEMCGTFACFSAAVVGGLCTLLRRSWPGALFGALALSPLPIFKIYELAKNEGQRPFYGYWWLLAYCAIVGALAGAGGGMIGRIRRRASAVTRE
jgi:hypothetical protein